MAPLLAQTARARMHEPVVKMRPKRFEVQLLGRAQLRCDARVFQTPSKPVTEMVVSRRRRRAAARGCGAQRTSVADLRLLEKI
jgi:hypothetical protein